ncbi:T9SS-dependent M36 family metallopeptidase [Hymenobacter metallilatus]|uniref:T9SS C-terminal target domain-containing protein n=1 Tax=Hymenobacter metallilatus TaxID=2493666 RepID=A0A428JTB2_9BACT|nr:T9SS-dependent M36 family metallopeptidase [Hymenobacter metallilatus]RSK37210.1 T9SS C-terminal target domain-containing protein [Hymenobacter metallilatus]
MKSTFTLPCARVLGVAAFLALPALAAAQNAPLEQALNALKARQASLGLLATDLADAAVTSQYTDKHNGITHVYLRQRVQGVEVYGAVADVHFNQAGKVASLHSSFLTNAAAQARNATPSLTAVQAVAAAAKALGLPAPSNLEVRKAGTPASGMEFNEGGISLDKIPVKLMYQPLADGSLRLAWDVTLAPLNGEHYWNARVDAATGALLDKTDYTISDSFSPSALTRPIAQAVAANARGAAPVAAPTAGKPTAANTYNVWPITTESPSHGPRQLVANPADATASPFGWHDIDGVTGAEYTITRGNNVHAYDDRSNRNVYISNSSVSPNGGANLEFNFPFDNALAASATNNLNAAVVNLFYWNNMMHDVMARKGFDEVSGNFQYKNYGGQALGFDPVQAEAQDGAAATPAKLNNANFSTPVDGARPRMQMYLWDAKEQSFAITAPASLAGSITAQEGANGRTLAQVGPITGNIVLANDGSANPARGCNPLVNATAISGNIALVQRGKCNFSSKIKNAQNAGARMVIVMDSIPNNPLVTMAGTDPDSIGIRIPSIFISKADGDRIRTALAAGQTVTFAASSSLYYRDGDFDNGIVAHEYGHGISNRLTGGPGNSSCLSSAEQMGEGWSDFFALWMTTKPGDVGATPRGVGTYAVFEAPTGDGIRRKPYTTNFALNNHTYAFIGTGSGQYSEVHDIGEIWAAVLWDLNWALIDKYGYNADLKAATGGNNVALQLVLDGCKLQKCNPGFIDGRNAILQADSINNRAANSAVIWRVFARRGMGFSARQGSANSLTDQIAAYDLPAVLSSTKQLSEKLLEVYPNPANGQVLVRTQVGSSAPVQVELVSLLGQRVSTQQVPAARLQQEGVVLNTSKVAGGVYLVRLTTSEGIITKKVVVQH